MVDTPKTFGKTGLVLILTSSVVGEPSGEFVDKIKLSSCPAQARSQDLALAFWGLLWARARCRSEFRLEAQSVQLLELGGGRCEVLVLRPSGDLRVELASATFGKNCANCTNGRPTDGVFQDPAPLSWVELLGHYVLSASIRRSVTEGWAPVTERLCLLTSYVGLAPVRRLVTQAERRFAESAINSERINSKCGPTLQVVGAGDTSNEMQSVWGLSSAIMGRAVQLRFNLRLCVPEGDSGSCIKFAPTMVAQVAVQQTMQWENVSLTKQTALRFLGSVPSPCAVSQDHIANRAWALRAPSLPDLPGGKAAGRANTAEAELIRLKAEAIMGIALRTGHHYALPREFDFRTAYPRCVLPIRGQGMCISGWAFAAVGSYEKQLCALSNSATLRYSGPMALRMSVQDILDCSELHSNAGTSVCGGGRPEDAFGIFFRRGVVLEECRPYRAMHTVDASSMSDLSEARSSFFPPPGFSLNPSSSNCTRRHLDTCKRFFARDTNVEERGFTALPKAAPGTISVRGEQAIQAAILSYGAVVSIVEIYPDFLDYWRGSGPFANGIYRRSKALDHRDFLGTTAVQLLGWGQEFGERYWIGENSFGEFWGIDGYFHWLRGEDHLGVERQALYTMVEGLTAFGKEAPSYAADLQRKIEVYEGLLQDKQGVNWLLTVWTCLSSCIAGITALTLCLCSITGRQQSAHVQAESGYELVASGEY